MATRPFRVDEDGSGNCEVSPTRPRKLRPLNDEETPAPKSALKISCDPESVSTPKPPSGNPPKSAMKSALKSRTLPEPEEEPPEPQPLAPKSALKKPRTSQTAVMEPRPPPQPPPKKAKSALKTRYIATEETPDMVTNESKKTAPESLSRIVRPSAFRMNIDIAELSAWTPKGLCRHYFYFAGQRYLWEQANFADHKNRQSIKLGDFTKKFTSQESARARTSTLSTNSYKLVKGQSFLIETEQHREHEEKVEVHHGVISPLKELFLEKKPKEDALRDLLNSLDPAERAKWVNAPLDATPPPMPAPLFFAVAAVHANLVETLIEFGVDVHAQYPGKAMLKGWIKPQTPLLESVQSRKGRFVGTMLGDKLERIEAMLLMALKKDAPEVIPEENEMPLPLPVAARRKSVQMRCTQGMMEHTHDHPSSKYELVGQYEDGNPSNVREAMNIVTGDIYAIKAGSKINDASAKDPEAEMWNEIGIIRKMDHPNIVRLHETFENDTHIFIVLEGCLGGELFDRLVTDGSLSEENALRIGYQMGSALRHLHQLQICHRDIQPECFFLADEGPLEETGVKLIDFATAKEFSQDRRMYTKICTLHYVAPEILTSSDGYTEKVDIWSFGVLLYIMLSGVPPFNSESDVDILQLVRSGTYSFSPDSTWGGISSNAKDLISKCLEVDVSKRLDTWGVMEHSAMVHAELHGAVYAASPTLGRSACGPTKEKLCTSSRVKAAFSMMAEVITDDQLDELRVLFKALDTEEVGMVELHACVGEVKKMIQHSDEAKDLLKLLDSDDINGRINYTMYLATMTDRRRHLRREAARCVFNNFDIDKNGHISLYEIAQALANYETLSLKKSLAKTSNVSIKEVQKIWSEMRDHFKMKDNEELSDREMTFDEFFKQLPNSNIDIGF